MGLLLQSYYVKKKLYTLPGTQLLLSSCIEYYQVCTYNSSMYSNNNTICSRFLSLFRKQLPTGHSLFSRLAKPTHTRYYVFSTPSFPHRMHRWTEIKKGRLCTHHFVTSDRRQGLPAFRVFIYLVCSYNSSTYSNNNTIDYL